MGIDTHQMIQVRARGNTGMCLLASVCYGRPLGLEIVRFKRLIGFCGGKIRDGNALDFRQSK
ncbi:hypothetical protein HMPREF0620_1154 [Parascardovia denticolens DSM 10105 = JCM 12538]|uniref:Uncharacterized protein n=1 Tax=Parascardovia denticolens DSM 10105 = JCM 12538 TaxID=864564 RepID=E6K037_PARDN|nr:hypothetical protein HMPREF0620_1154 [Parascardovia denticolens DSM 10105 = JCM 12538]